MTDAFQQKVEEAMRNPKNLGEMEDADTIGTVGGAGCGDMLRMWLKFEDKDGKKVIDKASFQSFGCETAIAAASMATEMLKGKTTEEAVRMSRHSNGFFGRFPFQHFRRHAGGGNGSLASEGLK